MYLMDLKNITMMERSHTQKECILYDFIYMKF